MRRMARVRQVESLGRGVRQVLDLPHGFVRDLAREVHPDKMVLFGTALIAGRAAVVTREGPGTHPLSRARFKKPA